MRSVAGQNRRTIPYAGELGAVRAATRIVKAVEIAATIVSAAAAAAWSEFALGLHVTAQATSLVIIASSLIMFETLSVLDEYKLSRLRRGGHWRTAAGSGALAAVTTLLCLGLLDYGTRTAFWLAAAMGVSFAGASLAAREISAVVLRRRLRTGRLATRVAVVGADAALGALAAGLSPDRATVRVASWHLWRPGFGDDALLDAFGPLIEACRAHAVDAVILAVPHADRRALDAMRDLLRPFVQDVYVLPGMAPMVGPDARPASLGSRSLLLVGERPLRGARGAAKEAFDRSLALGLILFMSPLLVLVAALIKLETPGPVLFRQPRVGYNNRLFQILKFRTMHHAAADLLASRQTVRGDRRVTRFGGILRQLSIDELPQLFNVLRGEMSLVGPRPHAPGTSVSGRPLHALLDVYACRHRVKPGITGLAQVRGHRGALDTMDQLHARVQADLEYIRRRTLWLDVKILVMTLVREIRSRSAY